MSFEKQPSNFHDIGTLTGRNVVQSIGDAVQALEEVVIVYALGVGSKTVLVSDDVDVRVHALDLRRKDQKNHVETFHSFEKFESWKRALVTDRSCSSVRLRFRQVPGAEQELTVQVRFFDRVHVRNVDLAISS